MYKSTDNPFVDKKQLFKSGGMPSSTEATVSALANAVGFNEGLHGPVFAGVWVLAIIVVHNKICVAERQAQENEILLEITHGGKVISHLQYANDTLCIGESTVYNLWTLKSILRGFEMASGLKINFYKSSLIGVNAPRDFMEVACRCLHCREGCVSFKYLG
ncbi:acid phosphatase/vanadium-dependent haloperoxidase [Medicago truncatula]|uniref:Acid phosphatase/vanadium-dependent haloperoxidase n=1 Tax=Medicago truncatula TaxID=3880 RepID=G7KLL0_MEDTR|nr:acid phosphatase/vanadium-dependent haloperoxidase [Medicago truncatula]